MFRLKGMKNLIMSLYRLSGSREEVVKAQAIKYFLDMIIKYFKVNTKRIINNENSTKE